jgi:L-lactate dehydrogenase complex protein LldG
MGNDEKLGFASGLGRHDSAAILMERVRRALGREASLPEPPEPPEIEEPIARLVYSNIGLPELFQKRATEMKMLVEPVSVDEMLPRLAGFLREQKSNRIMLSATELINDLNAVAYLNANGFEARSWREMTADQAYDFDAGVTEVDYAVAETGTLVIRHRPEHGRLLSLVPFVHVAIVEPKKLLPDLIDLFEVLAKEGSGSGVTMISGPSKTADIEMNTVTGVHGPNVVKAFLLA